MPWTDAGLPFTDAPTPRSRHCSRLGAEDAKGRAASQLVRYLQLLKDRGERGATDAEAAESLGIERSSVNARRAMLVRADLVYAGGTRTGASGIKNTVWVAR